MNCREWAACSCRPWPGCASPPPAPRESPAFGLGEAWLPVAYVVFLGTALAYVLYYYGIMNTSAQKASPAFFLKPVLASLLAAQILGETINA
ncbi:MAG TPA: DMT family transporter [Syntrophales bacterium]|jgi:drug/metabolite transporter (DMT)-like permease|nr:DMT family transporter [Syntrophales bacterium]